MNNVKRRFMRDVDGNFNPVMIVIYNKMAVRKYLTLYTKATNKIEQYLHKV